MSPSLSPSLRPSSRPWAKYLRANSLWYSYSDAGQDPADGPLPLESRLNVYAARYVAWQVRHYNVDARVAWPDFEACGWRSLDCNMATWERWDSVISARAHATRDDAESERDSLARAADEIYELWGTSAGHEDKLRLAGHPIGWFNERDQRAVAGKLGALAAKRDAKRSTPSTVEGPSCGGRPRCSNGRGCGVCRVYWAEREKGAAA